MLVIVVVTFRLLSFSSVNQIWLILLHCLSFVCLSCLYDMMTHNEVMLVLSHQALSINDVLTR